MQDGRTALKQASLNGHQNIVDVLLRGGANPDLHDRVNARQESGVHTNLRIHPEYC